MAKKGFPAPFETYRRYESKIRKFVKLGDFAAAIQLLESALAAEPPSPFESAAGLSWLKQAPAAAAWLEGVVADAPAGQVKAIYFEMNRFEINTSAWSIDAFTYDQIGDPASLEWLAHFSNAGKQPFVLPPMHMLQSAFREHFEEGEGPPPQGRAAAELAILLVSTRMQELMHAAVGLARAKGRLAAAVPAFSAVHDSDLVSVEATPDGIRALDRAKREARKWKELTSVRVGDAAGPGVYEMDTGYDERGRSYPRDSLQFAGDDDDLDPLSAAVPLADTWKPLQMTFRRNKWRSDLLAVYCTATAVNERAKESLAPLLGSAVEWLPIESNASEPLFLLHPLVHLRLAPDAVHNGGNGRNITVIQRHSFRPEDLQGVHLFQVVGPPDSPAGAAGHGMTTIYVSDDFVRRVEQYSLRGMLFRKVFPLG